MGTQLGYEKNAMENEPFIDDEHIWTSWFIYEKHGDYMILYVIIHSYV